MLISDIKEKYQMAKLIYINPDHKDTYLDSSEKYLAEFFDKPEIEIYEKVREELKKKDLSWPIKYHLSPQRHMLLNWFPFQPDASLLEIGAGCGAVTGVFVNKLKKVDCNELSPSRAKVIYKRFKNIPNLNILSGDVNELRTGTKYDYVTLIGVLEYSGKYSNAKEPYLEMLISAKRLLNNKGHLLIAIENKLGLKYIGGAPEDHTGRVFDSLENYPQNQGIRTFTKTELTELVNNAGFKKVDFYFPFPDYKMPQVVFSEEGLLNIENMTKSSILKTVDFSRDFHNLFNETALGHSLSEEKLMDKFANSFLVDAHV